MLSIGVPAGANSALMSVATVLLNNALVAYGDKAVAAMGIVTKAYMFIAFVHMGIANGIQPLLGYCYGANNRDRFRGILKFSGILTVLCGKMCIRDRPGPHLPAPRKRNRPVRVRQRLRLRALLAAQRLFDH